MIATIILSVSLAIVYITQSLSYYGCRALACIRDNDMHEVEMTSTETQTYPPLPTLSAVPRTGVFSPPCFRDEVL
jgi:hypothetical protein